MLYTLLSIVWHISGFWWARGLNYKNSKTAFRTEILLIQHELNISIFTKIFSSHNSWTLNWISIVNYFKNHCNISLPPYYLFYRDLTHFWKLIFLNCQYQNRFVNTKLWDVICKMPYWLYMSSFLLLIIRSIAKALTIISCLIHLQSNEANHHYLKVKYPAFWPNSCWAAR